MENMNASLRYARHLAIPEIGPEGQEKLRKARVLIVGLGGLGCPTALYLAAAGVGWLGLLDDDQVGLSNLQRQILYSTEDIGKPKVYAARKRLLALNPDVHIEARDERLCSSNAKALVEPYDLIVDGTDNFSSRQLINEISLRLKKPLIYGAISRFEGQVSLFVPGGACYRCLYPEAPVASQALSCEQAGVLGVLPGLVGMVQTTEALKWLLNLGEPLRGRLLMIDALRMSFDFFDIQKRADCPSCGSGAGVGTEASPSLEAGLPLEIAPEELKKRINQILLFDLRDPGAYAESHIPGARPSGRANLNSGLSFEDEVVLYCKSGARSQLLAQQMREQGFLKARHLKGGFDFYSSNSNEVK
jgi:adenylyltransferase/sulfurtransferase